MTRQGIKPSRVTTLQTGAGPVWPRIVVPAAHRRRTLAGLHDSHRGVAATKPGAHRRFLARYRCDFYQPANPGAMPILPPSQQREPLLCDDQPPPGPFESISPDFFSVAGKSFLSRGRLSGGPVSSPAGPYYPPCTPYALLPDFGMLVSPSLSGLTVGPQIYQHCLLGNSRGAGGSTTRFFSPHYPQANGPAEAAVKSVKNPIPKGPNGTST
ncbi:hypothetical protein GWK47_000915 [Chionoecetes opilio]|uniref:Uncharacterized protein n=1 Tax=Chionoecetes opilio TaxID=41210 RepID=A0A8J4XY93_CHIOP|nr:hypothetical protein GWK47_000915 [Chionoecetes opilio]